MLNAQNLNPLKVLTAETKIEHSKQAVLTIQGCKLTMHILYLIYKTRKRVYS